MEWKRNNDRQVVAMYGESFAVEVRPGRFVLVDRYELDYEKEFYRTVLNDKPCYFNTREEVETALAIYFRDPL